MNKDIPEILISIITVVYNGEKYLEDTINSVLCQSYKNIEYIIIDGGSTDGSVDIIKKYEDRLAYWVSEKDNGIYDAMNKGIQKATGEYIGLINSDDWYEPGAVEIIAKALSINSELDILYGNMHLIDLETNFKKLLYGDISSLDKNMSINHPTCFVRSELYKEKLFDTKYEISADYDFMLFFFQKGKKFHYINKELANMRAGGVSANNNTTVKERFEIHSHYFSKHHALFSLSIFKCKSLIHRALKIAIPRRLLIVINGYKK